MTRALCIACLPKWHGYAHCRPRARFALDGQRAVHRIDPLDGGAEPEPRSLMRRAGYEPAAIIGDLEHHRGSLAFQRNVDSARPGMSDHVVEGLLRHAVEAQCDLAGDRRGIALVG